MSTSRRRRTKRTSLSLADVKEHPKDLGRKYAGPFKESPFQNDPFKVYPTGIRGWYRVVKEDDYESYMYSIRGSKIYVYSIQDKPSIPIGNNKKSTSSRRRK